MPQWKSTPLKRKKFLEALALTGNVSFSVRASGLSQSHAYELKRLDREFKAAWEEAIETAIDRLEEEAWRRAIDGDEEYVISSGRLVLGPDKEPLKKRRKSDSILLTLLRAHRRKFRLIHQIEHSGNVEVSDETVESLRVKLAERLNISIEP